MRFTLMSSVPSDELKYWIPWKRSNSLCQWLYTGNRKFTEPFFDDTISACRSLDENRKPYKVVSCLDIMGEWANEMNTIFPSVIIFHVSRCGSTLLSQLLGLDESHIVLSEVPFFDELLRLPYTKQPVDIKTADDYLDAAITYYGQKKSGNEKYLFIKTDSWHLHFYGRLRALFPSVPFVLLYRNPLEVMYSHQRQRGMQSVPGIIEQSVFNFSKEQSRKPGLDIYLANVLSGYFKIMIEITKGDPLALPVDYKEGMNIILKKIEAFTGLPVTTGTELLTERCRFHAKHPRELFIEDHKKSAMQDYLQPMSELYQQLDGISLQKYSIL